VRARSMIKPVAVVAAGGLLVAVAVIGTRAMGGLAVEYRPLLALPGADVLEVVLLVAAVMCLPLLVAGMVLRRRARRAEVGGDVEWLRRLVFFAVLVASVIVLRELLPTEAEQGAATDADVGRSDGGPADVLWSGGTAILAVVLAAVAVAVLWWRRHLLRGRARGASSTETDDADHAVQAGQAALDRDWDDPRAAVVGCYAAMEEVLAESGGARGFAETPEELLQRAISDGRLAPAPGRQLTDLFLAARYSSTTLTDADVAGAHEALHSIEPGAVRWP
jgi:Domain of unknown function (DUF4129)